MAVVEDLVHREVFLEYFGVDDPDVEAAGEVEAGFEEEAAEGLLLPFVRYDDGVFGLSRVAAFYETGDGDKFAAPLLDGFCDDRDLFVGVYVAEAPGIIGGGAEG